MIPIITDINYLHIRVPATEKGSPISGAYKTLMDALNFHGDAWAITANQIGLQVRAFAMKLDTLTNIFIVNPVITKSIGEYTDIESCLSLPEVKCNVKRPKKIILQGFNENWQPVRYKMHALSARIACHEVDHLDGKLIIDVGERCKKKGALTWQKY